MRAAIRRAIYNRVVWDQPNSALPAPPFYFPLRHGRYDVAPGLTKLGKDHGGGSADAQVFQIDNTFTRYRAAKSTRRLLQHDGRHVLNHKLHRTVSSGVAAFMVERLTSEHPAH